MSNRTPAPSLFALREWLTVPEAAKYLSMVVFSEEVTEADVLRLALDKHLKIAVRLFDHIRAYRCEEAPNFDGSVYAFVKRGLHDDSNFGEFVPYDEPMKIIKFNAADLFTDKQPGLGDDEKSWFWSPPQDDMTGETIQLVDKKEFLQPGIYDLPMVGAERYIVERSYNTLIEHPHPQGESRDGILLLDPSKNADNAYPSGLYLCLAYAKSAKDHVPAPELPDTELVVRTAALREFQERVSESISTTSKPMDPRSESAYMNIIRVLYEYIADKAPTFENKSQLIDFLASEYAELHGISKRNLEAKLPKERDRKLKP